MSDRITAAIQRGLIAANAAKARLLEDYIGLPLAEPFAPGTPGLVVGLFPTAGRFPGGPNLVFPIRTIVRVSLVDDGVRIEKRDEANPPQGPGPRGSLGDVNDLARLTIPEWQELRSTYFALLDDAAEAIAQRNATDALRSRVRTVFSRLSEAALLSTYRAIAPTFMAWLGV
jgi:hypothetical protein